MLVRYVLRASILGVGVLGLLAGCGPSYSPNTYSANAVQQAAEVDQGIVVGVREVAVSADTAVGTVAGAAAGGIAGSQVGSGVTSAFGALGGSLMGGIAGSAAEHVEGDTRAFEYIVRKANGDLISVTQTDTRPLTIGEHVLVIDGKQARIVADYTKPVAAAKTETIVVPPSVPLPAVPGEAAVPPVPPPPTVIDPAAPASADSAPPDRSPQPSGTAPPPPGQPSQPSGTAPPPSGQPSQPSGIAPPASSQPSQP